MRMQRMIVLMTMKVNVDDTDDVDVDQLHQARHIPDHLPLKHLKHNHIDDGARRYALEFSIFRGF